jgi:amino acid adenylation domain-containing protein
METLDFKFQGEIFARLMQLSNQSDLRLFIILLTVLLMLLEKYTGSKDIIIGSPISKQETRGELLNTVLILRNQFHGDMTVKELLLQVSHNNFAAAEHQNYPIETMLYQLNIPFEEDEFPLFDIVVILENIHDRNYIEHIQTNICIDFVRTGSEVQGAFEFNTRRYKRDSIKRIVAHYRRLLERSLKDINLPVKSIELWSEAEKREILVDFNRSTTDSPGDKPLHELFRVQVEQTPGKIALLGSDGMHLTYSQLNENSNYLACRLREKGVTPDTIVGIMVNRSIEMLVGILGILKAGGAYLPIDPGFPGARVAFMLDDCGSRFLLSKREHIHRVEDVSFRQEIIDLGDKNNFKPEEANLPLEPVNTGTDLAYVIFTSGSTGKSKGTLTCHGNVARVVKNTNYIDVLENDRVLQLSNYAFDGSIFDIFGALLNGACLVLVKEEDTADADRLAFVIPKENITLFFLTTALFNLLTEIDINCLKHVRKVLFGGEVVSVKHVKKAREYLGKDRIMHMYGPTETTVYTTYYSIPAIEANAGTIPVGKPISNTAVYILDEYLDPLPIGGIGEIFIGGEGTARGYLNNPELTNDKFLIKSQIPMQPCSHATMQPCNHAAMQYHSPPYHPITPLPHHPIYKTGDLGRWLPGGNIEFVGRKDFQVKIRGFRIELEEIEIQLLNHKEIKEAKVLVWENPETLDKYLVTYFVPGSDVGETGLKDYLKKSLPYYMIPQYFISLEKMPLTPNGKVDSKALPEPGAGSTTAFIAPRDNQEKKLAEIWSEVLGVEKEVIGLDSDFFELGGHSLKAAILTSKIHKEFNSLLPLTEIFNTPTLRGLSHYIKEVEEKPQESIPPLEKKEYYPVSSAQKRMFLSNRIKGIDTTSDSLPMAYMVAGKIDLVHFEGAVRRLIKRHESLRTSFKIIDDEIVQRVHQGIDFKINLVEAAAEEELPGLIEKFIRSFDLGKAPLFRVQLVKLSAIKHLLLYHIHHIITDGTSMSIFLRDYIYLYNGAVLPGLKIQYKDFALWQNRLLTGDVQKKQEEYWLSIFPDKEKIPVLDMPGDFPRPAVQVLEGNYIDFEFSKDLTHQVRELVSGSGATLYMVLLAIYNILLAKYSGQEDIIVGVPIQGRRHTDLENLIGFFVNSLALRHLPGGNKTFREFLREVQYNCLKAYENQDYQFESLVSKLELEPDPARHTLYSTMFEHLDIITPELELDEVNIPADKKDLPREIEDLSFKHYKFKDPIIQFDTLVHAFNLEEVIAFKIIYSTILFKKSTIERFIEHFINIAKIVTANPDTRIAEISVLSGDEKEVLISKSRKEKLADLDIALEF